MDDSGRRELSGDHLQEAEGRAAERWLGVAFRLDEEAIIPICSHCRRGRDANGKWIEFSAPLLRRLETSLDIAALSHGICPACFALYYPLDADT